MSGSSPAYPLDAPAGARKRRRARPPVATRIRIRSSGKISTVCIIYSLPWNPRGGPMSGAAAFSELPVSRILSALLSRGGEHGEVFSEEVRSLPVLMEDGRIERVGLGAA